MFAASCANIIAWKENERLGRRVRRAEAEQAVLRARSELADRVMRLQSATEALARAATLHDVASAMIEHGVRGIGASSGAVLVRTDDGQLSVVAHDGMPPDVAAATGGSRRRPAPRGGRGARRPARVPRQQGGGRGGLSRAGGDP